MKKLMPIFVSLVLAGCLGMPEKVTPVENFNLDRYLGTWYEVARLDHRFERGLTQVTATYSLRDDGGIDVLNRGFSSKNNEWKEASGKAYFVDDNDVGYLKVSFFGPFYGSYVVFELDQDDYQYAFVTGPNTDYLWFLSRTKEIDESTLQKFLTMADERGFATSDVQFVEHK
ncbi:lipocalin [Reinekea thalattae]|uniref:Outer membrane lipoprotein Blc n=2 Tax=Reinekea thalattae TaxID=2593301 RepID=A0A5C8ZDI9_9GAMM|nr:lipocalin family protein [Reinekea thalattae]TXR54986.1 lipocalin [Reinekea thalattae]